MKKILIALLIMVFSFSLFAQEPELSDYEKYRIEKEKELYGEPNEEVFYIVEDMPKFQGEDAKEFRKYITQNVIYPQEAVKDGITGKVIVSFVVDKNGKVTKAKVEKSVDQYLDAEAIRVVMSSPKWTAGKQRGETVKVQFTFPINFVLDNQQASEPVVINNYYSDYTQPNYRFLLTFGYQYPYYSHYYDPWYGYGYPSYGAWYGGYYNHYAYYGMYYPYYGYNNYYGHNHNYWNYGYYSRPSGRRYATSNEYYKTYRNGYVSAPTAAKKNIVSTRPQQTRQATTTRTSGERNSYTPNYSKPRTNIRPEYNKSATRTRVTTQQRSTRVSTPASTNRSSSTYTRPTQSQSRSYRAPSTAPSRSYSAPSRSSGSSYSRSSSSSSSGRSSSSGSASRSSGGSRSGGKK